jgi:hypothetical protein
MKNNNEENLSKVPSEIWLAQKELRPLFIDEDYGVRCNSCGNKASGIIIFPDKKRKNICRNCAKKILNVVWLKEATSATITISVESQMGEIKQNQGELFRSKSVVAPVGGAKFASDRWVDFGRTQQQVERHRLKIDDEIRKEKIKKELEAKKINDMRAGIFARFTTWKKGEHMPYTRNHDHQVLVVYTTPEKIYRTVFTESGNPLYDIDGNHKILSYYSK